ncbi:MAG: hypothetical protein IKP68_05590, partial [Clostridia bacterium]|nr:hypothetical protein [Clostridia bacterium]
GKIAETGKKLFALGELTRKSVGGQEYNAEGKTIRIDTGKDVTIDEQDPIASVSKEGVVFNLKNGDTVNAKDLSLPTRDETIIVNGIKNISSRYGMDANTANAIYAAARTEASVSGAGSVMGAAILAYNYGMSNNRSLFNSDISGKVNSLSKVGRRFAEFMYEQGQKNKQKQNRGIKAEEDTVRRLKGDKMRESTASVNVSEEAQKVLSESKDQSKNDAVEFMGALADASDIDFNVVTDLKNENSKKINAQFRYVNGRATIDIDVNAKFDEKSVLAYTLAHELTHFIRDWSPAKYQTLADFLIRNYQDIGEGENIDTLIWERMEKGMSHALAVEELVAESCQRFLVDGDAYKMIRRLAVKDRNLVQKMADRIKNLADRLRGEYKDRRAQGSEQILLTKSVETLDRLHKMWTNALADAALNYRASSDKTRAKVAKTANNRYQLSDVPTEDEIEENISAVAEMDSVKELTGKEFEKGEVDLVTQVTNFFDSLGNVVHTDNGDIEISRRGAKSSIGHGIGRKKAAAFAAVPDVLKNGKIIDFQKNWRGRGYDTVVIAAPISIGQTKYYMGCVVNIETDRNYYYLHEVAIQEKGDSVSFKTGTAKSGTPS